MQWELRSKASIVMKTPSRKGSGFCDLWNNTALTENMEKKGSIKHDQRSKTAGSATIDETSSDIRVADIDHIQDDFEFKNDLISMNLSNAKPDSGDETRGPDTNYDREETCDVITKAHGEEKGVSVKNTSEKEKSGAVENDCGEENGDLVTNACGEEKGDSVTDACVEEKDDEGTIACGEKKGDSATNAREKEKDGSVANTGGEEKSGSTGNDCGEEKSGLSIDASGEENAGTNVCGNCGSQGCFQKCSRCKVAFYCSKECQKNNWPYHRGSCIKELTEEEKIKAVHKKLEKEKERHQRFFDNSGDSCSITYTTRNFEGPRDRFMQMLTLEQALQRATRPVGSLQRARRLARVYFPIHDIVTDFNDIPWEPVFPFFPVMVPQRSGYVLVAFMYRYHEHVMRHGVYLKDAEDKESKVEFYLDDFGDNPFPFFSYSQVKPGGYICLVDPVMHLFGDGSVGIRINNPAEVMVLDTEMVMKLT